MIKIAQLYQAQQSNDIDDLEFEIDLTSKRRPAWVKLLYPSVSSTKFLTVKGNYETTHYKLRLGKYFLPINSTIVEETKFYDLIASEYDIIHQSEYSLCQFLVKKLVFLDIPLDAKILDLYAGTGIVTEELVKASFWNIDLLDNSEKMLIQARKKNISNDICIINDNFLKCTINKKYDLIVCTMGMHYHEDEELKIFVSQIKKYLKKGGIYICAQPSSPELLRTQFNLIEQGFFSFKNNGNTSSIPYFIGANV